MCDPSVFLWLQYIRYHTENYEPTIATPSESRNNAGIMTADVEAISSKPVVIAFPLEVKHANQCRISCEFQEETVEELNGGPVAVVEPVDEEEDSAGSNWCDGGEPEDVMLWKEELRHEYSSEDECEEFTQQEILKNLEGIPEDNQSRSTTSRFPTVEIRAPRERVIRHSATIHIVPSSRSIPSPIATKNNNYTANYEKVQKLVFDGLTKKIAKGNVIKIENGNLNIVDDKGKHLETLKSNIYIVNKRLVGKKELELKDRDNHIYQLFFDKEKDAKQNFEANSLNEKTTIKERLLRLLRKRSSRDLLERKGIIKPEPIFGNTLRNLHDSSGRSVPEFVARTIELIESPKNITSQGVYRASGNLATIQKLRFEVDRGNLNVLEDYKDEVDVLTGALKLFFRELGKPLITYDLYEQLLKVLESENMVNAHQRIEQIINKLPKSQKDTFLSFVHHLLKVDEYKEENKMDLHNLSVVCGPSLLWFPDSCMSENLLKNSANAVRVMELILNVYKELSSQKLLAGSDSLKNTQELINRSLESIKYGTSARQLDLSDSDAKDSPVFSKRLLWSGSEEVTSQSDESLSSAKDYCLRSPMKGGIFGSSLQTLSEISKEDVPEFVQRVTGMVEKNIKNVGIYRQSGDKSRIDRIKKKVGKNKLSSLEKYKNDTAELACVLKQFFRELKEPLIPQEVVEEFVANYDLEESIRAQKLQEEIDKIPRCHRKTLSHLLEHFARIIDNEENKMSKEAISKVWAPSLCTVPSNCKEEMDKCASLIETLIDIYETTSAARSDSLKNRSKSVYDNVRGEASFLEEEKAANERQTKL